MSCLYILENNPFSVVSFAIIFSHFRDCLFTFLIVSFAVQKLSSLIRSHLISFVFISLPLGGASIGSCFDLHHRVKWSERPGKVTEKGGFSPHASPVSGCPPRRDVRCLLALAGGYKPPTRLRFSGLSSVIMRHQRPQGRAHHLLRAARAIRSQKHPEKPVKQSACTEDAEGGGSEYSHLVLKVPDQPQGDSLR